MVLCLDNFWYCSVYLLPLTVEVENNTEKDDQREKDGQDNVQRIARLLRRFLQSDRHRRRLDLWNHWSLLFLHHNIVTLTFHNFCLFLANKLM